MRRLQLPGPRVSRVRHFPMKILSTERLILRRFEQRDLPALASLYADPRVRRYFPDGTLSPAETEEELKWFLDGHPDHPQLGLWATIEKASGRFIGRCGLLPWTIDGMHEVEVAYLLDPAWWGRGLASEAARGIVAYAFGNLGHQRVIALIDPENVASIRVAEAAGLRFERMADVDGPCSVYAAAAPR